MPGSGRHLATPRVLIFLTCFNQARGEREVLLLKGAPTKRLWANRYNGLGGHVEAAEDVYTAAVREVREEAGIEVRDLSLRGVVTIDAGADEAGRASRRVAVCFYRCNSGAAGLDDARGNAGMAADRCTARLSAVG
ncbi:MAG: NUDIX domain-containing protein [Anaerolineales bacterium]|nr:NUDIX domain-containing protein [Anaerolineales bacterium]